jgi:cell division protein FtsN
LSYAERLLRDAPPEEKLKTSSAPAPARSEPASAPAIKEPVAAPPAAPRTAPPDKEASAPVSSPTPAPPVPTPPPASAPAVAVEAVDPSGPGYAIQVAAYRDRRDADSLAKQLIAKGYPAFVMDPVKGAPMTMFRVRVGKYKNLKDAEAISARLQSAEQFDKAWIAR